MQVKIAYNKFFIGICRETTESGRNSEGQSYHLKPQFMKFVFDSSKNYKKISISSSDSVDDLRKLETAYDDAIDAILFKLEAENIQMDPIPLNK
jgi:hypothetical protein